MSCRWYAVATWPGRERTLVDDLEAAGRRTIWLRERRLDGSVRSLFDGYVFVAADADDLNLETEQPHAVLGAGGPAPVDAAAMARLLALVGPDGMIEKVAAEAWRPSPGDPVVADLSAAFGGSWDSTPAVIAHMRPASGAIAVIVRLLGRETVVYVPQELVEPAAPADERGRKTSASAGASSFDRYDKAARGRTRTRKRA